MNAASMLRPAAALIAAFALLASATPAWADTFTVESTLDAPDAATGNSRCETAAPAACTLRAAVQEANELDGKDRIVLPAGRYSLTVPGDDENLAATGDLDLADAVDIVGRGTPTVDANGGVTGDRAFDVQTEAAAALSGLRIVGGSAIDSEEFAGGGILNRGELNLSAITVTKNTAILGGGVGNVGSLTVDRSTVGGAGGDPEDPGFDGNNASAGGGLINASLLGPTAQARVTRSTVSGNVASRLSEEVGVVIGGGVASNSALELENVTVTGNRADAGEDPPPGPEARGGGIAYDTGIGQLSLLNVTASGNGADEGGNLFGQDFGDGNGGGTAGAAPSNTAKNTLVANSSGGRNCGGVVPESLGNNLEYDAGSPPSCALTRPTDITGHKPRLGPLADNGGPTQTHALMTGSPAIDAADNAACPSTDQRGVGRPQDGDANGSRVCDIGAFELRLVRQCSDGRDNDRDGKTDYPRDPGCSSANDNNESNPPPANDCTVTRGSGNDVIRGTPGDDVICAGDGNDVVYGGGGNDTIRGGDGHDVLRGHDGNDRLIGGDGNDLLRGGGGEDRVIGGPGNDSLYGNGGADSLDTQDHRRGNDVAHGGRGADSCASDPRDIEHSC